MCDRCKAVQFMFRGPFPWVSVKVVDCDDDVRTENDSKCNKSNNIKGGNDE